MSRRLIMVSFFVSFLVLGISGGLLGPTLESLTERFGLPLADGGIFITLHSAGVSVSLIGIGWLFDSGRYAPRYLLCLGPVLTAIGLTLLSVTTEPWLAYVAALTFGLGFGGILIGPNILISAMFDDGAASRLNALNTFFGIGAVLGPQVVNIAFSLENVVLAYLFTAVAALALIPAFLQVDTPARKISGSRDPNKPARRVNWLLFVPFAVLLFVYVGAEVGFGAWIATQLRLVNGLTEETATLGVSLFWAGLTSGRIIAIFIARYMRAVNLLTLMTVIFLAGSLLVLASGDVTWLAFVGTFVAGFGCGPIFPTTVAVVSDNYPEQFAAVSGVILGVGNGGAMLLPWVQGQVGGGVNGGVIVTAASAMLMLVIIVVIQLQVRSAERAAVARPVS